MNILKHQNPSGSIAAPNDTTNVDYLKFKETLPDNLRLTPEKDYHMYEYWRLNGQPENFDQGKNTMFWWDRSDKGWHAGSIAEDPETGIYHFMKPKHHSTVGYELDWFNKGLRTLEGGRQVPVRGKHKKFWEDFTSKYQLDTTDVDYKYVPVQNKGGSIQIKKKNRGKFTDYCGGKVTEECIARGKRSKNPLTRKRANFASVVRKWKHENGGILKAQEGTGNLLTPHPLSPVGIALNQAKAIAKMRGEQQHLPPGVKEVVGPDGKKVAIRTEQPLVPLEQSIAEWLPGTGDVAEIGYIGNDLKNGRYGSAALAAGLMLLPGAAAHKFIDLDGIKKVNVKLEDPTNYWYVAHQTGSSNFSKIAQEGLQTGSGLNGTALHLTDEYMDDFANGRLMQKHMSHQGADGMVVMKFPKDKFPSGDLDDISIRLMELEESKSFEVPSKYLQFFKRSQW